MNLISVLYLCLKILVTAAHHLVHFKQQSIGDWQNMSSGFGYQLSITIFF